MRPRHGHHAYHGRSAGHPTRAGSRIVGAVTAETRWDELARAFDPHARALGITSDDRALLAAIVARTGWGPRAVTVPFAPCGVRHGIPWGVSVSRWTTRAGGALDASVRVFLAAEPPAARELFDPFVGPFVGPSTATSVLPDADRVWHAVGFARGRAPAFHVYACVPDRPEAAWRALAARGHDADALRALLPARARVTIVSADLGAPDRLKLYTIVPDARIADLPLVSDAGRAFAREVHPSDAPIGWLVCYAFRPGDAAPSSVAVHFAARVHGHGELRALHFLAHTREPDGERVTRYEHPEARTL